VDLVYTSSRSLKRKQEAEWEIIADFSSVDMERLKTDLRKEKGVKSFRVENLQK